MKLLNCKSSKPCEIIYDGKIIGTCENIIWDLNAVNNENIELIRVKMDPPLAPDISSITFDVVVKIDGNSLSFRECYTESYTGIIISSNGVTFESVKAAYYFMEVEEKKI